MPVHRGWLPREGFVVDPLIKLAQRTVLNPGLLLPLLLLARFTKKGEDLSILHPTALSRFKTLFYVALAQWLSSRTSDGVMNNWTSDKYDWPNEIAVVTGGAGGIGGHVARLLAEKGCKVVVLDILPLTYDPPSNLHYYKCDLTNRATISSTAATVREQVGNPTILVNNAGVARGKTILETSERDLKFTFDVNMFAHFYTVQEFLPSMVANNHGMIVTVASFAAFMGIPNMGDYAASKAACQSFHESLAAELVTRYKAPKIRTVIVNQGHTKTPLFTGFGNDSAFLNPSLEPESVADAIVTQIFSGRSGHVLIGKIGNLLEGVRGWPRWLAYGARIQQETAMKNWNGRQIVSDLNKHYTGRDKNGPEGSTVLVPKPE